MPIWESMGQKAGREGPGRGRDGPWGTPGHDRVITAAGATADGKGRLFSQNRSPVLSKINFPISSPSPDGSKEAAAAKVGGKRKAKVKDKVKGQEKVKVKEEAKVKMKEKVKG